MPLSSIRRLSLWLPPIVYMAVIFGVSAQSDPVPQVTAHVWDKLLHVMEYGGLAFLFARALAGEGWGWSAALAVAIVLTSGYGASDEWHQAFVPLRSSDVQDWMADTFGAALGAMTYVGVVKSQQPTTTSATRGPL